MEVVVTLRLVSVIFEGVRDDARSGARNAYGRIYGIVGWRYRRKRLPVQSLTERLAFRDRWDRITAYPLMIAATVQLFSYIWSAGLGAEYIYSESIGYVVWFLFLVDYLVRLYVSKGVRWQFVKTHPLDLLAVALPAFRFLRVISAIIRLLAISTRGHPHKVIVTTILITTTIWLVGAAAVRDAESNSPEANITGFPEALWWSLVTITTVGYGDFFPVTTQGRFVAAVLMITGIAALGSLTGAVATKLLAGQKSSQSDEIADLKAALAAKEEASK